MRFYCMLVKWLRKQLCVYIVLCDVFCFYQNEVGLLRNEVTQLKQLLLAHKDCPVTAMQKKSAYIGNKDKPCMKALSITQVFHSLCLFNC